MERKQKSKSLKNEDERLVKQLKEGTSGITLVALVITIVVLIILATITINIALNGGIVDKAQKAKTLYESEEQKEQEVIQNVMEKYAGKLDGGKILNVKIKLDEANVSRNKALVQVENVINENTGKEVTEGLKYTYSLEGEEQEEITQEENSYEFTELDKEKSYVINVKVQDANGNYGEASIEAISFIISDGLYDQNYLRCENGITWEYFCKSEGYNPKRRTSYEINDDEKIYSPEFRYFWVSSFDNNVVKVQGDRALGALSPPYDYDGDWYDTGESYYVEYSDKTLCVGSDKIIKGYEYIYVYIDD